MEPSFKRCVSHFRCIWQAYGGVLSDGIQRLALRGYQSEEIQILNVTYPRVGMESTTCRVDSRTVCVRAPQDSFFYF